MAISLSCAQAQRVQYSTEHRDHTRDLPRTLTGPSKTVAALSAGGNGVSLVVADFDSDGTPDLISGYSVGGHGALVLQRGNPRATAPTPVEWAMTAAGQLVAPYVAKSEVIELPVSPDMLVTADFAGHGNPDLLAAARGGSTVYFLRGRGDGSFSAPQVVQLAGPVTALATWRGPAGENLLVAGVCGSGGCGLQFLDRDGATKAFVHTSVAVTGIQTGSINAGRLPDFALIAGGQVLVLDGDSALKSGPTLETLSITGASAIALGTFVPDHHPGLQVAVLGTDATLHVITRAGIDSSYDPLARHAQNVARAQMVSTSSVTSTHATPALPLKRLNQPWTEAETVPDVGPGGTAIMLRARLSGGGNDDLAIMAGSQYITVAHPLERSGNLFSTTPVVTAGSLSAPVTVAVATRVSADARHGIVSLLGGGAQPLTVSVPSSYRTMTVNTTADGTPTATTVLACTSGSGTCTLRSAITAANRDRASTGTTKVDTINIPAGTYVLSAANTNSSYQTQNPDYLGSVNYHLELDASANLVGAGCATSGTPTVPASCSTVINANQVDQAMVVDYGSFYATSAGDFESAPVDVFVSGLTLESGRNPNSFANASSACGNTANASYGDCNPYGGNLQWTVEGVSSLVLNNVLITGGSDTTYGGGGVSAFYDVSSSGLANPLEIDNSAITNNAATSTNEGGGGLVIEYGAFAPAQNIPVVLTSDLISGNTTQGIGGGVYIDSSAGLLTVTNSKITANTAPANNGGGLYVAGPLTMSGTVVSSNSAIAFGGGLYAYDYTYATNITASSFLSNSITGSDAGLTYPADGGGVCLQAGLASGQGVYSIKYSRFHGNTGGHSTGLGIGCNNNNSQNPDYATVTATDNWWGCVPSTATNGTTGTLSGTGCDTAGVVAITAGDGTLSTSPYTTLTLSLNSTAPSAGTSLIATASLGQDSAGTVYPLASDAAYTATTPFLPSALISTFTITNTTSPAYNPSSTAFSSTANAAVSYAAATAVGTANATGTGTATVTVDGVTVTRTYTVTAPDLTVTSTHTGNFKAGDTGDTYTLTVGNVGTSSTSGTVTVVDTLPSGFTATAMSGTGWSCTVATATCTSSSTVAASVTFPAITLTVSVAGSDVGTYTNNVAVSGGSEVNTNNDTATDSTVVVGAPTISEAFSPTTVAPNATSTVTFTLGNASANSVSLTGVAFTDTLPTGLIVYHTPGASTTCTSGTVTAAGNGSNISLSGATIAAGATCTVTVTVQPVSIGSYTNTTGTVTATNSNAGGTASATLTASVTPTKLVYTSVPASAITAGGNAGTVSVALEDASGNVATNNSTTSVTVTVTGPSSYSQTYTATDTNGVASFNLSSVPLTIAGTYTYTATATGLTQAQSTEVVSSGTVTSFTVTGLSTLTAPQMAGTATVKAIDAYGNVNTGFTGTVTLSSTDSTAVFSPASYTFTASDAGVKTFTVTFNTAGTFSVSATSGSVTGSEVGILVEDSIVILNTNSTVVRTSDAGVQLATGGSGSGTATHGAVAFDNAGNIWTVSNSASAVNEYTKAGVAQTVSGSAGAGVASPVSVFIDGIGQVWVANGNSSISVLSSTGAAVSPSTGYTGGIANPLTTPSGIIVDSSGSVWVTNRSGNSVTKFFGAAAPVVTPTVTGTTNNTLGTRP